MKIEYSAKTLAAIKAMTDAVNDTEKARREGLPYAEKGGLYDAAKAAAKAANEAIMTDALNVLADRIKADGPVSVVKAYLDDWTVDGFAVVQDSEKKGGAIHTDVKTMRISYAAMDAASRVPVASNGGWRSYMALFAANAIMNSVERQKGEEAAAVAIEGLSADLIRLRDAKGGAWLKHSRSALTVQFNELVEMILPEGFKMPKLLSEHTGIMIAAATDWVDDVNNTAARLRLKKLDTIENRIMTTIMTRYKGLAINIETGLSGKKDSNPNTPAADEAKGGDIEVKPAADNKPVPEAKDAGKPAGKTGKKKASAVKNEEAA